ncbi:serine/threonine-protein kinase [Actinoplanes oblitus]|uniref:non-specific serine/threonine protein kinase n=1 Tax=Actinoplanes oblitus TaxID=3040509 RepID=A0ABY8WNT4_9ACTN|nr:serine/threonine-protein kinase [Actinoplanes oblitus]WIM99531.1 serine/threonine-protein kinase [Actinoplanes oblitus]
MSIGGGLFLNERYRLLDQLGAGGMAVVWRARDQVLGRVVAVKLMATRRFGDRIRQEALAAAALSHPNIAQVYDYGETEHDGRVLRYVVMELVPGSTLAQRLMAGPLPPRFALRVGAEIAAALSAAHGEGLVHRDIKPGNVILGPTGAKVVDFGIAAAVSPAGSGVTDTEVLGTPAYLAPERLFGLAVTPASDVYALGVVLYLSLTGQSPWTAEDTRQMLDAHVYVEPAALPPVRGVPGHVVRLTDRCLVKDPAGRPSAREVAGVLAAAAGLRVISDDPPAAATGIAAAAEPTLLIRAVERARHLPPAPPVPAPVDAPPSSPAPVDAPVPVPAPADAAPGPARPRVDAVLPVPLPVRVEAPVPGGAGAEAVTPGPMARRRRLGVAAGSAATLVVAAGGWLLLHDRHSGGVAGAAVRVASEPAAAPLPPSAKPSPAGSTPAARRTSRAGQAGPSATPEPSAGGSTAPATTTPATRLTTATATAPASTPPTTATPVRRTLSISAGTVEATCPSPGTARILSWKPAQSYKVQSADPGPGPAPTVTFKRGSALATVTVTCAGMEPSASVSG